jgi:hypothetical protein
MDDVAGGVEGRYSQPLSYLRPPQLASRRVLTLSLSLSLSLSSMSAAGGLGPMDVVSMEVVKLLGGVAITKPRELDERGREIKPELSGSPHWRN